MSYIDPFQPVILSHPRLPLTAHIIPLGLNITRLVFQDPSTGETNDVIGGPEDPRDHWDKGRTFIGPLVGRYANRLPSGKSKFSGGEMDLAEFSGSGICHHGGPEVNRELPQIPIGKVTIQEGPLDRLIWTKVPSMHSQLFPMDSPSHNSSSSAIFAVVSKAGSNGFPGMLRIEAKIAIQMSTSQPDPSSSLGRSAGVLKVEYRALIVDDCEATPFNITQHWGFNLSASNSQARAAERSTILDHLLRIEAIDEQSPLYTLDLNEKMMPTGNLIKCQEGGEHDWLNKGSDGLGRPIKEVMSATGYDHYYAWGQSDDEIKQREINRQPRLTLHSPATKFTLSFKTNQSGTQIYTANGQPDAPADPKTSGGNKKLLHEENPDSPSGYAKHSLVFLEFAHPHATFLHEEYQKLAKDTTVLKRLQRYHNLVEVELYKG